MKTKALPQSPQTQISHNVCRNPKVKTASHVKAKFFNLKEDFIKASIDRLTPNECIIPITDVEQF